MVTAPLRLAVSGFVLLAGAGGLSAQTLPLPTLPPTEKAPAPETTSTDSASPESPAGPAEIPAPAATRPWEYALKMGVLHDSNVAFVGAEGAGYTAVVPGADLTRVFASSRGELRVSTSGLWAGYPAQEIKDRFYFDAGGGGEYRLSAGTSVEGDFRYDLGYSDSTPVLIDQGVALPLVKTRSLRGELGLTQRLGPRTALRAAGRVLSASFDSPELVDGNSLRGSLTLDRTVGARDTLGVTYALERSTGDPVVDPYLTHYGSLQWSHTLSQRSALLLEGGASYTPDGSSVGLQRKTGFYGGVTFVRKIGRSNATAFLRREVAPAFGLGVSRLETRAGLDMDVPVGRRWHLRVQAVGNRPDAGDEGEDATSYYDAPSVDIGSDLSLRLGRRVSLTAHGRYRRRGEVAPLPSVSDVQAGLHVTFGSPVQ